MKDSISAKAYGRVNLIGEHTDYNNGVVLPTAIKQYTETTIQEFKGDLVSIVSSGNRNYLYQLGQEMKTETWADYLQGATKFIREKLGDEKTKIKGFKASISSTIPEGSGLSSSAALEMSFLKALNQFFELGIDFIELAKIGQRIENEFVGAHVGIMDQLATGLAKGGEALFIDTQTLEIERIQLPLDEMDLIIINSGISHKLSGVGGYNERRFQCEEACRLLKIKSLREVGPSDLDQIKLPVLIKKRVTHVVKENERVILAVKALKNKDLITLGQLFIDSHYSMRDDYQVSIDEIDLLVQLCMKEKSVYGARLTGGGFGGSIVALCQKGEKNKVISHVLGSYKLLTGINGTSLT